MLSLKNNKKGFTIIEVLIVLAIAGLIMLIVFLAVPALQRNSRNTQRRADVSHLLGLVSEYISNHNGSLPTGGFVATGSAESTQLDLTSENFSMMTKPSSTSLSKYTGSNPEAALDTVFFYTNINCNNNAPTVNSSPRSYAVIFFVEPKDVLQCLGD